MTHESEDAKVTDAEKVAAVEVDMGKDGLLWLVNASVFHHRGFALAMPRADHESLATVLREYARRAGVPCLDSHADALAASLLAWWAKPILQGDGREVWQFDMENEPTPDQRFAASEALFARIREAHTRQPDTTPLAEDVSMNAMGPRHFHADRECAWHARLGLWVTSGGPPDFVYVECLREHEAPAGGSR